MDLLHATRAWRGRPLVGYLVAVVAPLVGLAIRLLTGNALTGSPFVTFFPAVLLAAFLGGPGPGLLASLLSAALVALYFDEFIGSLALSGSSGWLGFGFFVLTCAITIGVVTALNTALDRLASAERNLRRANETLERRVAERTADLVAANATRQAAEAQLRQSQKMEAIGQLTGGIAHDFNNMLAIVFGSLDVAKRRLRRGDPDIVAYLDHAMDGANRAAVLTRRLLAFARQQPLAPVVIDVNDLVQGMAELLRRTIGETTTLECVLASGLWQTHIDPAQLENAILNLAVNARDAMPGGGRLTIETSNADLDGADEAASAGVAAGRHVVVAVSDTGAGMSPDTLAKAFEPFFTTKEPGHGTGLGLSQVHGFVQQSGGQVRIDSEPGRGTTVRIYLRRAVDPIRPGAIERTRQDQAPAPRGSRDEIILVVEDEDGVRRATVDSLRELGYTVRHAASGAEALSVLENQPGVGLLFTDVVMPGMTGRKLADLASARWPDLKIVFATGYTRDAIVHDGELDPGVELLQKPYDLDQLARKMRRLLDPSTSRTPEPT